MTPPARLTLPMDQQAASRARAFYREASCATHNARVLDAAQLLVSELVTNAVRHGAPPVTLEIECDGSAGMQVRVSDGSPEAPELGEAGDEAESGRGIVLVDLLTDDWGVEPAPDGKAVWFRLAS